MMNYKSVISIIGILICINISAHSQNKNNPLWIITGSPQYILNKGIRLDAERQLNKKNQFLNVSALYYEDDSRNKFDLFNSQGLYEKMNGFGIKINHKIFFSPEKPHTDGTYMAYGVSYEQFMLDIPRTKWESHTDHSLEYYTYKEFSSTQINFKFGPSAYMGFQLTEENPFLYDFYCGVGFRYVVSQTDYEEPIHFTNSTWDYGYMGPVFILGFRIGGVIQ